MNGELLGTPSAFRMPAAKMVDLMDEGDMFIHAKSNLVILLMDHIVSHRNPKHRLNED